MSFQFVIEADASKAQQTIADVKKELASIESQTQKVGGDGSSVMATALQDELRLLERIHGPVIRYESEMAALDRLLAKETITVHQYTEELRKLNNEMERSSTIKPTEISRGSKTMKGVRAAGAQMGEFASGIGLSAPMSGAGIIAGATVGSFKMADASIEQDNSLRRLTDSYHDLNRVRADMLDASHALHSDLAETADLFDAVRDGSEALALSYQEQLDLTRALGAVVKLDNKSLGEASGAMERLSYAMASGKIESRELKGMMRELPQLAQIWGKEFGLAPKELIKAVEAGKISVIDLVGAISKAGPEMEKELGDRPVTWSKKWDQFKDSVTGTVSALRNINEQSSIYDQRVKLAFSSDPFAQLGAAMDDWEGTSAGLYNIFYGTSLKVTYTHDTIRKIVAEQNKVVASAKEWGAKLERINDLMEGTRQAVMQNFLVNSIEQNSKMLDKIVEGHRKAQEAAAKYKQSTEYQMLQLIRGPLEEHTKKLAALDKLWMKGKISMDEYRKGVALVGDLPKEDFGKTVSPEEFFRGGLVKTPAQLLHDQEVAEKMKELAASRRDADFGNPDLKTDVDKYDKEMEKLKKFEDAAKKSTHTVKDLLRGVAEGYGDMFSELQTTGVKTIGMIEDALVNAAKTGKFEWKSFLSELAEEMTRLAVRLAIMGIIRAASGDPTAAIGANAAVGAAAAGAGAGARTVGGGRSGGGGGQVVIYNIDDKRALLNTLGTREGGKHVMNVFRQNPGFGRMMTRR